MRVPLLTPQDEITLAARIKMGERGSGLDDQSKPPTGR
jgi:hypothetical protein